MQASADASRASAEATRISADAARLTALAAGDRAIATLRIKWLEDLRRLLAEYHATLQSYTEEDERKVLQLGTELDLMLNLDEPAQKALWDIADRLFDAEDIAQRREMDKELMAAGRVVLKAEWNKIKWELRGKPLDEAAKHATTVALKE